MIPKNRNDDLELPPLRAFGNIPPLPPTDSFGFPRQQFQFQHILPPPIPTITHASALLPTYSIALPRLPPMAMHPQISSPPSSIQSSISSSRYYPQQPSHMHANTIYHPSTIQVQSIGSTPTTTARAARKEIKRRTKTGCLTCRKRRIKCDERRPICRNCEKSKRECEGYDPIFRGTTQPTSLAPAMQNSPQSFGDYTSIDPTLNEPVGSRNLPGEYDPRSHTYLTAPPLDIEDILDVGSGLSPPLISTSSGVEGSDRETVTHLFQHLYAPAIDKFLETKWFTTRALAHLLNDAFLLEKFRMLKSRFVYTPSNNMHEFLITQSLEAHVIWETMLLARQVSLSIVATNDPATSVEVTEGVHDVAKRVNVFEALVTNQQLNPVNGLSEPPRSGTTTPAGKPALQPQLLSREQNFWYLTSKFCTLRNDSKRFMENPIEEIEKVLSDMRQLLDSRENRDIIYSIAVVRHVGHNLAEKIAARSGSQSDHETVVSGEEQDIATRVHVARRFIQEEAGGKGTSQVTQRVCGMAAMAWSKR